MKKINSKNFVLWVLVFVCVCTTVSHPQQVKANLADKCKYTIDSASDWSNDLGKIHIRVKNYFLDKIEVRFQEDGYSIQNLESDDKNLQVRDAGTSRRVRRTGTGDSVTETFVEEKHYLTLLAKKSGAYRLDFDICDADGVVRKHKTIEVYANNECMLQSLKVNGSSLDVKRIAAGMGEKENFITNSRKVSVKVKMTKGYEFKKMTVKCYSGMKKSSEKTIKNGGSFKIEDWGAVSIYYLNKYTGEEEIIKFNVEYWNYKE